MANKRKYNHSGCSYEDTAAYRLATVEILASQGYTLEGIAKSLGCSYATLYNWCKKYPELKEAIRAGRSILAGEVEAIVLKIAKGGNNEITTVETEQRDIVENGEKVGVRTTTTTRRRQLPSLQASKFYLEHNDERYKNKADTSADSDGVNLIDDLGAGGGSVDE